MWKPTPNTQRSGRTYKVLIAHPVESELDALARAIDCSGEISVFLVSGFPHLVEACAAQRPDVTVACLPDASDRDFELGELAALAHGGRQIIALVPSDCIAEADRRPAPNLRLMRETEGPAEIRRLLLEMLLSRAA